jgi:hypothetical protein
MRLRVGVREKQWCKYLSEARPDEVNFRQPAPTPPFAMGKWFLDVTGDKMAGYTPSTAWAMVAARRFQDHRISHAATSGSGERKRPVSVL